LIVLLLKITLVLQQRSLKHILKTKHQMLISNFEMKKVGEIDKI